MMNLKKKLEKIQNYVKDYNISIIKLHFGHTPITFNIFLLSIRRVLQKTNVL